MKRERAETPFAIFTFVLTVPYFMGETYHYFAYVGFGQGILNYLVDLIAIGLFWLASISSLRDRARSAAGWLAAAWGFAACLNYRSFTWRYEAGQAGEVVAEPSGILVMLGATLIISFIGLAMALYLSRPKKPV
ncbi:MAG: hypothetical protein ABJG15_00535 [Hyphomonadaceae bacterium]